MSKSLEITWDEKDGYMIDVIEWDDNTPDGAEPSGVRLAWVDGLDFNAAIERLKEEMIGLLPK